MAMAPRGVNDDQADYWNGDAGQRWVDGQEAMDAMLAPFGEAAMEAAGVAKGAEVIDLGCGCGGTTLELARRTGPMGRVIGIDISTPMLRRAQQRASEAGLSHTLFINTDASTHGFEAQKADLAFSRFGVMFFANPIAAFANIHRGMRAEGHLAFACWRPVGENEWVTVPREVALRHVAPPEPMKPGAPGPFAFAEPAHVATVLGRAGFRGVTLARFDHAMRHEGSRGGGRCGGAHGSCFAPDP
jgi:SAM-dependent methyltransferase